MNYTEFYVFFLGAAPKLSKYSCNPYKIRVISI